MKGGIEEKINIDLGDESSFLTGSGSLSYTLSNLTEITNYEVCCWRRSSDQTLCSTEKKMVTVTTVSVKPNRTVC